MAGSTNDYRVAVFYTTEEERRAAEEKLRRAEHYRGVIDGWCSAQQLAELTDAGLTVDVLKDPRTKQTRRRATLPKERLTAEQQEAMRHLEEASRRVSLDEAAPALRIAKGRGRFRESADNMYSVTIDGPLTPTRRQRLENLGIEIAGYEAPGHYRLYLTADQRSRLKEDTWIHSIRPYTLADSVSGELLEATLTGGRPPAALLLAADGPAGASREYDVICHRAQDLPWVRQTIDGTDDTEVIDASDVTLRFRTSLSGDDLDALLAGIARLHEVRTVVPYEAPSLYVDHARRLIGLEAINRPARPRWTGRDEVVAIFDSGVDRTHPDLRRRVIKTNALVGTDAADRDGHGTHVAGIVAGTGAASGGRIKGGAPDAKLVVFRVVDDTGTPQVGPDLSEILLHAVDAGAHIVNLSWGWKKRDGAYDLYAMSLDRFVHEHPDVLVVVAAGNDGRAPKGDHWFGTIGSPGTAKNALTVGASDTDRKTRRGLTWFQWRQQNFPLPPAGDEPVAGHPDLPAAISGRGPTDFGSVKPDVVAPGTFILSTRTSSPALDVNLIWGKYAGFDGRYVYSGGTSMAAPLVAAAAAVLRQYLRVAKHMPTPSAALLKAALVASVHRLPPVRREHSPDDVGYPDFDQGFGRVDLSNLLPAVDGGSRRVLECIDVANDAPEALEAFAPLDGSRRASRGYRVRVADGARDALRVVVAWTDPPGNGVQNNLDLSVVPPGGRMLVGNSTHTYQRPGFDQGGGLDAAGYVLDKLNNVELVVVEQPPAGEYRIRVVAQTTTYPPAGFAVCVCGDLVGAITSEDEPPPPLPPTAPADGDRRAADRRPTSASRKRTPPAPPTARRKR